MNIEEEIREAIRRYIEEPPLRGMSDLEWAAYKRGIDAGMTFQRKISRESEDINRATHGLPPIAAMQPGSKGDIIAIEGGDEGEGTTYRHDGKQWVPISSGKWCHWSKQYGPSPPKATNPPPPERRGP